MKMIRCLFVSLLFCCQSLAQNLVKIDPQNDVIVGDNITIQSQFNFPVVEPHISVHPSNIDHLLVAAMVVTDINRPYQSCRLSSFVSKNSGKTWKETAHDWWGYDPWTAILEDGSTVMTWLGTSGSFQSQYPLQFFRSDDAGESWTEPQTFAGLGHGHDGTKVVGYGDDFYYTTVRFNAQMGADVVLYHSSSKGKFEEVAVVDSKGVRLNFCEPVILTDGTVLVPSSHYLSKLWVQQFNPKTKSLSDKYLATIDPGGAGGYMRMVADVGENSPFKDRVYFVRALGSNGNYRGIWLNYSDDKGQTWTRNMRIDLFDNKLESRAIVPSVAVNKDGIVGISWSDAQMDPELKKKDIFFAISKDGGDSFQRPVRVTSVSSDPKTEANGEVASRFSGGGHYLNVVAKPDGSFQLIWSDSRSGKFELQTANVMVN